MISQLCKDDPLLPYLVLRAINITIQTLLTFSSGGVELTVRGKNMDAVALPYLTVTVHFMMEPAGMFEAVRRICFYCSNSSAGLFSDIIFLKEKEFK